MEGAAGAVPRNDNVSRKIISIAAGEAHNLALAGDGCVYSWGRGTFGRLGTGSEEDVFFPVRIAFGSSNGSESERLKFVGIAAGSYHSLALSDDGFVWSWGYNIYGQLGFSGENSLVPHQAEQFIDLNTKTETPLKVCSIKAGGMMSLAIDNLGALWMWGNCPKPSSTADSEFSFVSISTPIPIRDFHGHTVVKVACGNEHVIALVSARETYNKGGELICYSWGSNNHGQLGQGDKNSRLHPKVIKTFDDTSPWEVYDISCGAFHTALLTHKKGSSDRIESQCWTFGLGDNGQLGHGNSKSVLSPEFVKDLPPNAYLVSIDCGLFHTSVVSSTGEVFSWGMENGRGLLPDASYTGIDSGDALSPLMVNGLKGPKFLGPVKIACGPAHTVVIADDGYKLWSWGRGWSGVLGNGKTINFFYPCIVLWPPFTEDFSEEKFEEEKLEGNKYNETERRLSVAMEEIKLMELKFSMMNGYASILHTSIFGKPFEDKDIPGSLQNLGAFDIAKEWEKMLESADNSKLARLEVFYRSMLAGVKDKLMKRRIQEIVKECVDAAST